ncbi:tetratricopeptide repeat protein [Marinospirillum sp.]|uniref:tetratricopeptide repeat protein n=1 Tax=Marinospirillum sp. TaxID=2183934 RepID=UPI00384B8954
MCHADDRLEEMLRLNSERQFSEAYSLGKDALPELAGSFRFDMAFGKAALEVGEYDQALFAFERVLMLDPSVPLPRLELARAHFELGNLAAARRHFNRVLDGEPAPPPQVAQRIQWYLSAIEAREEGRAVAARDSSTSRYIGLRLGYDSNVGSMTSNNDALQQSPIGQALNLVLPDPENDFFNEVYAGVTHFELREPDRGIHLSAQATQRSHLDERDSNELSYGWTITPVFLGENSRLLVPFSFQQSRRHDDSHVTQASLGADYQIRLDAQTNFKAFGQVNEVDFGSDSNRDTRSLVTGISLNFRPDESWSLTAGPVLGADHGQADTLDHFEREYLGLRNDLALTLAASQQMTVSYHYTRSTYGEDHPAFMERRRDKQHRGSFNWIYYPTQEWQLEAKVEHINNRSTLDVYDYERTQLTAGIRREW